MKISEAMDRAVALAPDYEAELGREKKRLIQKFGDVPLPYELPEALDWARHRLAELGTGKHTQDFGVGYALMVVADVGPIEPRLYGDSMISIAEEYGSGAPGYCSRVGERVSPRHKNKWIWNGQIRRRK